MTTTITLDIHEYNRVDGYTQSVQRDRYPADWLGTTEKTVRNFLAGGSYDGSEERYVEVSIIKFGEIEYHGSYTAPQIRRFHRIS